MGGGVLLTCAHVLDVARHAHDQAPIRKAVDQLPAPALIFRSWNPRRDLPLLDCTPRARALTVSERFSARTKVPAACTHRGGDEISRLADQRRRAWFVLLADGAGAHDRHAWPWHDDTTRGIRIVESEGKSEREIVQQRWSSARE